MIITEKKPFGLIKAALNNVRARKILIVSCDMCARICETGGSKGAIELKERLEKEGYKVDKILIFGPLCNERIVKSFLADKKIESDTIIVLACDAGAFCIKKLFPKKNIINALDTKALGVTGENGEIYAIRNFE